MQQLCGAAMGLVVGWLGVEGIGVHIGCKARLARTVWSWGGGVVVQGWWGGGLGEWQCGNRAVCSTRPLSSCIPTRAWPFNGSVTRGPQGTRTCLRANVIKKII